MANLERGQGQRQGQGGAVIGRRQAGQVGKRARAGGKECSPGGKCAAPFMPLAQAALPPYLLVKGEQSTSTPGRSKSKRKQERTLQEPTHRAPLVSPWQGGKRKCSRASPECRLVPPAHPGHGSGEHGEPGAGIILHHPLQQAPAAACAAAAAGPCAAACRAPARPRLRHKQQSRQAAVNVLSWAVNVMD